MTLTPVLLSVRQWSCHYLFLRLRPVSVGNRTSNLLLAPIRRKSLTKQSVIIMTSVFLVNSTQKMFQENTLWSITIHSTVLWNNMHFEKPYYRSAFDQDFKICHPMLPSKPVKKVLYLFFIFNGDDDGKMHICMCFNPPHCHIDSSLKTPSNRVKMIDYKCYLITSNIYKPTGVIHKVRNESKDSKFQITKCFS